MTVENLIKTFTYRGKETRAVSDLTFSVSGGRTLGLLGPNGAGKTTTLRILATVSRASHGDVHIAGHSLAHDARLIRQIIGYVPQSGTLLGESAVGAELIFQGKLFGLSRATATSRGQEVLAALGASELWGRQAQRLSGGERRKVDLAMGMMNRPVIVFLDEPTAGLDPDARKELWAMIRNLRTTWGTTVILTTHYLDEAEELADDILLLEKGRMIAHDTTQHLRDRFAVDRIILHLHPSACVETVSLCLGITGVQNAELSTVHGDAPALMLHLREGERTLPRVLHVLQDRGQNPTRIVADRGGLQDAFFALTGKAIVG